MGGWGVASTCSNGCKGPSLPGIPCTDLSVDFLRTRGRTKWTDRERTSIERLVKSASYGWWRSPAWHHLSSHSGASFSQRLVISSFQNPAVAWSSAVSHCPTPELAHLPCHHHLRELGLAWYMTYFNRQNLERWRPGTSWTMRPRLRGRHWPTDSCLLAVPAQGR